MATQVQWRGGSTAEHSTFTGAAREVTVDTQKKTLVVHDGSTAGGEPLLREDQVNLPTSVTNGLSVPSTNNVAISTNGTGRLFVDANGNVGVGTSTPAYSLDLGGVSNPQIRLNGGTTAGHRGLLFAYNGTTYGQLGLNVNNGDLRIRSGESGQTGYFITFETGGSEKARITSEGKLGLGTSSPSNGRLHVVQLNSDTTPNAVYAQLSGVVYPGTDATSAGKFVNQALGASAYGIWAETTDTGYGIRYAGYLKCAGYTYGESYGLYAENTQPEVGGSGTAYAGYFKALSAGTGTGGSIYGLRVENTAAVGGTSYGALISTVSGPSTVIPFRVDHAGSTRFTVDSSGRVGIGTTSAISKLHVSNSGAEGFEFTPGAASNTNLLTHYNRNGSFVYVNSQVSAASHQFFIGASEAARIDASSRLLVGTSSSPSAGNGQFAKLLVQGNSTGTGAGVFNIQTTVASASVTNNDDIGFLQFTGNDGNVFAWIRAAADGTTGSNDFPGRLVFSTTADGASSPTERMRITNAGHILFGTTDADAGINGTPSGAAIGSFKVGSGEGFRVSSTGAHYWNFANDGSVHIFRRNGTNVGSITVSSGATAYNTSSDYRLKENVVPLTGAANRVNQLHVHRFNFIADPNKTVDGFIAHEAQAVVPECVTGTKDAVDADGNPVYQGIDQSKLVPLLTAALQEALAEIESLKARVTALEP